MLSEKIVVITGGAGLLGRRFSEAVARAGAVVVVADRNEEDAGVVAAALVGKGLRAERASVDIGNQDSLDSLIACVHERYGRIDAVVNAAYPRNRQYGRKLEDVTYPDFCENTGLHLGGYFLVAQRFAIYFSRHGGGNIVNLSSIYGTMAPRFDVYDGTAMTMPVEYAAIKAGVIHLTRYFAQYYKKSGVRCNSLAPGGIFDNQPASFIEKYQAYSGATGMLDPDDCSATLVYLLSDGSRHVTGQNVVVDDGFSL